MSETFVVGVFTNTQLAATATAMAEELRLVAAGKVPPVGVKRGVLKDACEFLNSACSYADYQLDGWTPDNPQAAIHHYQIATAAYQLRPFTKLDHISEPGLTLAFIHRFISRLGQPVPVTGDVVPMLIEVAEYFEAVAWWANDHIER